MIYFRGAPNSRFGKGDFKGVWVSNDRNNASQYGKVYKYKTTHKLNLLKRNLRRLAEIYFDVTPEDAQYMNSWEDVYMFPPDGFVKIVSNMGYDGWKFGNTQFIIEPESKLKMVPQRTTITAPLPNRDKPKSVHFKLIGNKTKVSSIK